ncbi:MAG TPA: hypothetical protein PLM70_08470 [Bacteroidales bacterium]|nr:hypothetical protein [Bacteroidales bacterium]
MRLEKEYTFQEWSLWNWSIIDAAEDFYNEFNHYPNFLFANEDTFSQINLIVCITPEFRKYFIKNNPEYGEVEIGSFENKDFSVRFLYNSDLADKDFIMMFTDDDVEVVVENYELKILFPDNN